MAAHLPGDLRWEPLFRSLFKRRQSICKPLIALTPMSVASNVQDIFTKNSLINLISSCIIFLTLLFQVKKETINTEPIPNNDTLQGGPFK